ncbi:hypothetical protein RFI_13390 [Reticulomyxa filosa]|uniref:Uncharacterized protein n=1 Tax=Reticulomyxa filosa TaxID=46433 RepID=X6NCT6_RETFI|nr:hypothetical protein RFI_13390 [Reticulomyxa filosa]|eukprot:ETO23786.1 hypothetical protein RFI_13390 [Reticulomyxa filosa]
MLSLMSLSVTLFVVYQIKADGKKGLRYNQHAKSQKSGNQSSLGFVKDYWNQWTLKPALDDIHTDSAGASSKQVAKPKDREEEKKDSDRHPSKHSKNKSGEVMIIFVKEAGSLLTTILQNSVGFETFMLHLCDEFCVCPIFFFFFVNVYIIPKGGMHRTLKKKVY